MPSFSLTVTFRRIIGEKSYWEEVAEQLQRKGARILGVDSKVSMVGESPMPINKVTITYEASREIKTMHNR